MSDRSGPRVALVHDWLTGMRGGEKVLEAIAGRFPRAPIYTLFHFPGSVSGELESHAIHTSFLQEAPLVRNHYRSYLPLYPAAIADLDLTPFDLVVSTSHCAAKAVRTAPGARHVCYCHTPMRYAWDQQDAYFPDRTSPIGRLRAAILARLRAWDASTAPRVDLFVANSTFVAGRISRYYGRGAEVVHPPVDTGFFTPDDRPRKDFALFVSALAPYKRVETAIEACRARGVELRVVGEGAERRQLEAAHRGAVRFLGRVEGNELRDLYREAAFFVQPGIEDFGIATVEALACGCPVVARGVGGVRDIVVDGLHGVLYDGAGGAAELSVAIDKFHDLRFNSLNLRERAEMFSAVRFDREMEEILMPFIDRAEGHGR